MRFIHRYFDYSIEFPFKRQIYLLSLFHKILILDLEIAHCKHFSKTGYFYEDFIHIDLFENKLTHGDYVIDMPLYIRADQDAHILLSADKIDQAKQAKGSAPVYEIGGYYSKFIKTSWIYWK